MRIYTVVLSLLLVTGCASLGDQLRDLRAKNPTPGEFPQALASEYLAYAESLAEEGHPIRADHFAQKGLDALAGRDVPPETGDARFAEGRDALLAVLDEDVKEVAPLRAARAQIMFDCWTDKEKLCKESFADALTEVQYVADALEHGQSNEFAVDFTAGSARLSAQAMSVLDVVAYRTRQYDEYQVELTPPLQKGRLATERVLAVQKYLIRRGVNAGNIATVKDGKGKKVTLSVDKKKIAAQRVKIFVHSFAPAEDVVAP